MGNFVLGVDGGGTKTQCALYDINGKQIDIVNWGPTNYETMKGGFQALKEEIGKLISFILDKNGLQLGDIKRSVFGLAGVDTQYQHGIISGILDELGLKNHILCNDAYLGVKAGTKSGYGICAINGTGCTVVGIDAEGNMIQIGGFGAISGDRGGGGYLGKCAVSAVYDFLYRDGSSTNMKDIIFELLNINSKSDFMNAIVDGTHSKSFRIKDFNRVVFKAANLGDRVALDILEDMGRGYARSINSAIRRLNFCKSDVLEVVLAGSIYVKGENPAAINSLKEDVILSNRNINIDFHVLEKPPVMGAVLWALE